MTTHHRADNEPVLSLADAYHTGFVVDALEPAMEELTRLFGVSWTEIEEWHPRVRTPEGALDVRLRFVYTKGVAPHIELLEPVPGTVWERPAGPGPGPGAIHHVGVWAENLAETSDKMVADGLPRVLTFDTRSGRAAGFAYHRLPSGALVELVDASGRRELEAWLAGGPHPNTPAS
jgi:catechol 2,3-dioxygenase-like lactoylglutathione lyase family enzyme